MVSSKYKPSIFKQKILINMLFKKTYQPIIIIISYSQIIFIYSYKITIPRGKNYLMDKIGAVEKSDDF